ncbi:glycosyltransferase [Acinetobacter ihumii]|uniref:glycosyltransferase n=1 Tax=Acinetobacter ihumii TaxID=2483802 RepID=UPI0010326F12|nr:glycosyltransferase [Acinetobacter ihumii]
MNIGVVIPAFNEEEYLEKCLAALHDARQRCTAHNIQIEILVVLDSCSDKSIEIVQACKINYLECNFKCVGKARDLGVRHFIAQGIYWVACTDADSEVTQDWFIQQCLHQPTDVICGVVEINNWQTLSEQVQQDYALHYHDEMHHRHIHGANLCFSTQAYQLAGGFDNLECHEDVGLVEKMQALGLRISWSNKLRVITSARLEGKAPQGFSNFLFKLC